MDNEQIIKEFREKFTEEGMHRGLPTGVLWINKPVEDVEDFILKALTAQRSQFHAELEAMSREVEGKKQAEHPTDHGVRVKTHGYEETHNWACTTIQSDIINPRIKKYE